MVIQPRKHRDLSWFIRANMSMEANIYGFNQQKWWCNGIESGQSFLSHGGSPVITMVVSWSFMTAGWFGTLISGKPPCVQMAEMCWNYQTLVHSENVDSLLVREIGNAEGLWLPSWTCFFFVLLSSILSLATNISTGLGLRRLWDCRHMGMAQNSKPINARFGESTSIHQLF